MDLSSIFHVLVLVVQAHGFQEVLIQMANRPQDYITPRGHMTTNSVEGFHGLALVYRDKCTDLGHSHYICKTNMAICHKVLTSTDRIVLSVYLIFYHLNIESRPYLESAVLPKHGCSHARHCSGEDSL